MAAYIHVEAGAPRDQPGHWPELIQETVGLDERDSRQSGSRLSPKHEGRRWGKTRHTRASRASQAEGGASAKALGQDHA